MNAEPTHDLYESCDDCVYSMQEVIFCTFMGCKHAFTCLKECFVPRNEPKLGPKLGRWVRPSRPKTYERVCSGCGKKCWYCGTGDYDYCPWCGAKMEGEKEG